MIYKERLLMFAASAAVVSILQVCGSSEVLGMNNDDEQQQRANPSVRQRLEALQRRKDQIASAAASRGGAEQSEERKLAEFYRSCVERFARLAGENAARFHEAMAANVALEEQLSLLKRKLQSKKSEGRNKVALERRYPLHPSQVSLTAGTLQQWVAEQLETWERHLPALGTKGSREAEARRLEALARRKLMETWDHERRENTPPPLALRNVGRESHTATSLGICIPPKQEDERQENLHHQLRRSPLPTPRSSARSLASLNAGNSKQEAKRRVVSTMRISTPSRQKASIGVAEEQQQKQSLLPAARSAMTSLPLNGGRANREEKKQDPFSKRPASCGLRATSQHRKPLVPSIHWQQTHLHFSRLPEQFLKRPFGKGRITLF